MPLRDYPFIKFDGEPRPALPIFIHNPENGLYVDATGLIDTGARTCCIPAEYATELGHNLTAVRPEPFHTASKSTAAYRHTATIEIYHPVTGKVEYIIEDVRVAFVVDLGSVLLGVEHFLERFRLDIDYQDKSFSITRPRPRKRLA